MIVTFIDNTGQLNVLNPGPKDGYLSQLSDDEFLDFLIQKDVPADATNITKRNRADLPTDRSFRDAWAHDLTVDKPKAVAITQKRLRQERIPLLAKLDGEELRAPAVLTNGPLDAELARIATEKPR